MTEIEEKPIGKISFFSNLMREILPTIKENMIFSPKLAQMAIATLLISICEKEEKEIRKFLHLNLDDNFEIIRSFHEYHGNCRLSPFLNFSTNLFYNIQYDLLEAFKEIVKIAFHVIPECVDFEKNAQSAEHINCWARYLTCNRIKRVVKHSAFDKSTSLVLVSISVFKAPWRKPFDPAATKYGRFYLDELRTIPVDMLTIHDEFLVADIPEVNATAVQLEFAYSDLAMTIFLPKSKTGLNSMNRMLIRTNIFALYEKLQLQKILLQIPKFKTDFEIELSKYLEEMGLSVLFRNSSTFKYLLKQQKLVNLSNIFQKIVISINEAGSEIPVEKRRQDLSLCKREVDNYDEKPKQILTINRPFTYLISAKRTLYYFGFVMSPLKNDHCSNYCNINEQNDLYDC